MTPDQAIRAASLKIAAEFSPKTYRCVTSTEDQTLFIMAETITDYITNGLTPEEVTEEQ
jgi:hypothetical protein